MHLAKWRNTHRDKEEDQILCKYVKILTARHLRDPGLEFHTCTRTVSLSVPTPLFTISSRVEGLTHRHHPTCYFTLQNTRLEHTKEDDNIEQLVIDLMVISVVQGKGRTGEIADRVTRALGIGSFVRRVPVHHTVLVVSNLRKL